MLLILAGISISMLTGQNGILNRAQEAKEKTKNAQDEENEKLQEYEKIINQYEKNLPTEEGTIPYLPDAKKFEKVEGTDLSTGLVIREKATGSEYVWVEVPRTMAVYSTAGVNISSFTDEEYIKIEEDLHEYTKDYRKGTSYSDVYYTDSTNGWFTEANEYNKLKQKMLKSIYENGGFWVGRYEAGIENEVDIRRTASATATLIPVTKQNMYPYNYVTRTQAKVLAEKVESGSYTSSLMFGVQWDLVLKYIETKFLEKNSSSDIKSKLTSNSTTIGNYNNNLWNITNVNAKYSADPESSFVACPKEKTENASILLTTGADESFSLMNIYDIAGNAWEWTLEKSSNDRSPCSSRRGNFCDNGSEFPASSRDYGTTSSSGNNFGFRLSIY